jgi:diguanylate cyclase (GGDEF)-like protein/putative nucleotidyltransferase with HDIG domain
MSVTFVCYLGKLQGVSPRGMLATGLTAGSRYQLWTRAVSLPARAYVILTATVGVLILQHAMGQAAPADPVRYVAYLICAVLTSRWKVRLPGITGTMSVNFFFIMLAIIELDLQPVLVITCAGTLGQMLWRASKKPRAVQVVFNLASVIVASYCAYTAYHWPRLGFLQHPLPVLLFLATGSFFLVNTWSVSGIIALTEARNLWTVWRASFVWTGAQYMVVGALAGLVHVLNQEAGWEITILLIPVIYLVYRSYDLYLRRLEEEKKHVAEMADLHLRTIEALALAIDAKDDTTHDHLRRVKVYATEIGNDLGLTGPELQALEAAALLHDIGKLAVPEYIISKPGKLTPEEFEKMKIHPVVGAEILERVSFPYPVVPVVRAHHEKWDGSGYPDGLKGEDIPIGARILGVVDCLDALASDRQYRRAFPLHVALEKVVADSGKSFDPRVVEVLQRRCVELEQIARASSLGVTKLSTKTRVERGAAPGAGFENTGKPARAEDPVGFLASIAAARQEFHMLGDVLNELGSSLSVDETLSLLAARLKHMIPYDTVAIYVRKEQRLIPQFVNGEEYRLFSSLEIPMGDGLSGWVAENRRPIINGNPSVEPGYLNDPSKFSRMRSALSVPLEGLGGVAGVLTLYHAEADAFTRDHLRILQAISSKAGLAIENALKFRQVENSAVTDELTGLPNARSLFIQLDSELARAKRTGAPLVVLVLDLDGFKSINDRFGHLAGNKVLKMISEGLHASCREYDCVARMGGDEFVAILAGSTRKAVAAKAMQYREVTREVGLNFCHEDILSVSVGEACFPEDGTDAEQLLAVADKRMYQAKQSRGRSRPMVEEPAEAGPVLIQ